MNLKEAFRFQNKLQDLQREAACILNDRHNTMKTEITYFRKKVMPEAEDETVEEATPSEYADQINGVSAFVMMLLDERTKLSEAIRAAKGKLSIDMDNEISMNRMRQDTAELFRIMSGQRSNESTVRDGGVGYRFNAEGNQVSYRCDAKRVSTINFDRNLIRGYATKLSKLADETSAEIDRCLVTSEVAYEPPFEMSDSFDEILRDYLEKG